MATAAWTADGLAVHQLSHLCWLMACPRCFCRVPARSPLDRSGLVCADCGTALPPPDQTQPHVGWLAGAVVAVLSMLMVGVVIVAGVSVEEPSVAGSSLDLPGSDKLSVGPVAE